MFIFARELSLAFIENLEDAEDFMFWSSKRDAEDVSCMVARQRIDRRIKERRSIHVLDHERLPRDQRRARDTEPRVETYRVLDAEGDLCPQFALLFIENK